jgi:hypothetical protein
MKVQAACCKLRVLKGFRIKTKSNLFKSNETFSGLSRKSISKGATDLALAAGQFLIEYNKYCA